MIEKSKKERLSDKILRTRGLISDKFIDIKDFIGSFKNDDSDVR